LLKAALPLSGKEKQESKAFKFHVIKNVQTAFYFCSIKPGPSENLLLYVVIKSHTQILFNINKNNPPFPVSFITMI